MYLIGTPEQYIGRVRLSSAQIMSEAPPHYPDLDDAKSRRTDDEETGSLGGDPEDYIAGVHAEESDHAIQYRTCSWQKVRSSEFRPSVILIVVDRCAALLRVHLSRDYVVSLVRSYPITDNLWL